MMVKTRVHRTAIGQKMWAWVPKQLLAPEEFNLVSDDEKIIDGNDDKNSDGEEIAILGDDKATETSDFDIEIPYFAHDDDSINSVDNNSVEGEDSLSMEDSLSIESLDNSQSNKATQEALFQRFHKKVSRLTPSDLPGKPKTFKEYLEGMFENSKSMHAERLNIQKRCKSTVNFQDSQLRAMVAASFPPVKVGQLAGRSVPVTFEGDKFPQFSQLQKRTFLCEVCIPFQKWSTEHGRSIYA